MIRSASRYGYLLCLVALAGCQQQATPQHSLDSIVDAYQHALIDGQYASRLAAFVHPQIDIPPNDNLMLADRKTDPEQASTLKETSPVRELTPAEQQELTNYFDFAVLPTHVVDFTTVSTKGPSTWTSVTPLYLAKAGDGWNVVVGSFKSQEELKKNHAHEQLSFEENQGLWQHHWELQFEADSPDQYELVLKQAGNSAPLETILAAKDIRFNEDQKVIRFHLIPQGADSAWEKSSSGTISIPFAWQTGSKAMSSWSDLPVTSVSKYEPNRNPRFEGDTITLARFVCEGESGPVEFILVVNRLAK